MRGLGLWNADGGAQVSDHVTAVFKSQGVSFVRMNPRGAGFAVQLTCGGPAGYGETFEEALADAQAKNADWLGEAA
jgi:hypothetical protein